VDLVRKVGSEEIVLEIVNGKRAPSEAEVKVLSEIFHVSGAVFT
jgi:antitoxin component HigA of HigAB toxin-antitoxin module